MKISELVLHLSGLLSQHGDVEVDLWDEEVGCAYSVSESQVEFVPGEVPEDACVVISFDQNQLTD